MDFKKQTTEKYAIVIGDWHFNSLGLVRSLGEMGITVFFINLSLFGYAENSKYVKKFFHVTAPEEIFTTIVMITKEVAGIPFLFPASDLAAMFLDNYYSQLKDICVCPGAKGNLERFMSKDEMCRLARNNGFNVPEFYKISIDAQWIKNLKNIPFPFIIKPEKSVDGNKSEIRICTNETDLKQAIDWIEKHLNEIKVLFVQQFVNGNNNLMVEYCGYKIQDKPVKLIGQLEKIREYPVNRGSTSFAVIKNNITYLDVEYLNSFLNEVEFDGIFDLELKVVDGHPYFIEINFRNGAPSYAFTVGGFNIPFNWLCEHSGLQIQQTHSFKETFLMSERDDLNHVIEKKLNVFSWLKNLKNCDTLMIYNKADKKPFIKAYNKIICLLTSFFTK